MHDSAKVLIAVTIACGLTGIGQGLRLKRMDEAQAATVVHAVPVHEETSSLPSSEPAATVVPVQASSVPESPRWQVKPDGSQYLIADRNWTFFKSIDPISARPVRQVCGYDEVWLGHRVCIGGPFNNVTFRFVNETIDFDVFGSVVIEARFETARGPVIRQYAGFAASQWDGVILAQDQVDDFLRLLNRARKTVIRVKLTEGFATITLTRRPKVPKDE